MFGRATIRLGIGPHSSGLLFQLPITQHETSNEYNVVPYTFNYIFIIAVLRHSNSYIPALECQLSNLTQPITY